MLLEALFWCLFGPLFWISDKVLWVVRRLPQKYQPFTPCRKQTIAECNISLN